MEILKHIHALLDKPVAIFGAGVSGKAAADLIESLGGSSSVYDENNSDFPRRFILSSCRANFLSR